MTTEIHCWGKYLLNSVPFINDWCRIVERKYGQRETFMHLLGKGVVSHGKFILK